MSEGRADRGSDAVSSHMAGSAVTTYQSVKVPTHVHRRARILSGALDKNLSAIYAQAIELLWRQSKGRRAQAARKLVAPLLPSS